MNKYMPNEERRPIEYAVGKILFEALAPLEVDDLDDQLYALTHEFKQDPILSTLRRFDLVDEYLPFLDLLKDATKIETISSDRRSLVLRYVQEWWGRDLTLRARVWHADKKSFRAAFEDTKREVVIRIGDESDPYFMAQLKSELDLDLQTVFWGADL